MQQGSSSSPEGCEQRHQQSRVAKDIHHQCMLAIVRQHPKQRQKRLQIPEMVLFDGAKSLQPVLASFDRVDSATQSDEPEPAMHGSWLWQG